MKDYTKDFDLDPKHVWLNAASEGPIPRVSVEALQEAVTWKQSPHRLTIPKFQQVPFDLKKTIATLIRVPDDEIILGNSATYGLHLLANGLRFESGDEIIVMCNDFPTDILPWLHLEKAGVVVRQLKPQGEVLTSLEVKEAMGEKTKLVCLPMVHTFSGHALDVVAIGNLCRERGILFIVNMSQAFGAFDVDVSVLPVDGVVSAGYKWLLGPYGTGFCWLKTQLRQRLNYPQAYWIALMDEKSLSSVDSIHLKEDLSVKRYDVFGTANFFNYVPWNRSIAYLMQIGMDRVSEHNQHLVSVLIEGLQRIGFRLVSPNDNRYRSNIVVFSHVDPMNNVNIASHLKDKGVHLAFWKNNLRASPHIYNTTQDIERLLTALYETDNK